MLRNLSILFLLSASLGVSPLPAARVMAASRHVDGQLALTSSGIPSAADAKRDQTGHRDISAKTLPLAPPGQPSAKQLARSPAASAPVTMALAALGVVLGLFFLLVWLAKRSLPAGARPLPADVVEVLGRSPLAHRQDVQLLRVGRKLILVSVSAAGAETLTEITDPPEVDRLAGLCKQASPQSATTTFRHLFDQLSQQDRAENYAVATRSNPRDVHTSAGSK